MEPNENKMSDGGRKRASLGVELWKSSQKSSVWRSDVRSIAWLGVLVGAIANVMGVLTLLTLFGTNIHRFSASTHALSRIVCPVLCKISTEVTSPVDLFTCITNQPTPAQ